MNNFSSLGIIKEVSEITYQMWEKGWDEANGGNITYLLSDEEAQSLNYEPGTGRKLTLVEGIPDAMRGKYILVTATGSYFREIKDDVNNLLGIIYLPATGNDYEIAAGLEGGNRPTSELGSHITTHAVRLEVDPQQRVVMHNHATHVLAMTHSGPTDEQEFTIALWRMITEGVVVFPDGIGLVPWCVAGTPEIAEETNERMKTRRCVVWQYHGVFTTGRSLHDAFGLLETVDKCAEAWLLSAAAGRKNPGISNQGLKDTALRYNVKIRENYIN